MIWGKAFTFSQQCRRVNKKCMSSSLLSLLARSLQYLTDLYCHDNVITSCQCYCNTIWSYRKLGWVGVFPSLMQVEQSNTTFILFSSFMYKVVVRAVNSSAEMNSAFNEMKWSQSLREGFVFKWNICLKVTKSVKCRNYRLVKH